MYFLERVAEEAERSGGELVRILGNHETLNIAGRFRYAQREGRVRGFYEMARSTKDWNGVEEDVLREREANGEKISEEEANELVRVRNRGRRGTKNFRVGYAKTTCTRSIGGRRCAREASSRSGFSPAKMSPKESDRRCSSTLGVLEHHALYGLENINKDIREWASNAENPEACLLRTCNPTKASFGREITHTEEEMRLRQVVEGVAFLPGVERVVVGHTIQKAAEVPLQPAMGKCYAWTSA